MKRSTQFYDTKSTRRFDSFVPERKSFRLIHGDCSSACATTFALINQQPSWTRAASKHLLNARSSTCIRLGRICVISSRFGGERWHHITHTYHHSHSSKSFQMNLITGDDYAHFYHLLLIVRFPLLLNYRQCRQNIIVEYRTAKRRIDWLYHVIVHFLYCMLFVLLFIKITHCFYVSFTSWRTQNIYIYI